jgi:hypothetical protein
MIGCAGIYLDGVMPDRRDRGGYRPKEIPVSAPMSLPLRAPILELETRSRVDVTTAESPTSPRPRDTAVPINHPATSRTERGQPFEAAPFCADSPRSNVGGRDVASVGHSQPIADLIAAECA